MTIDPGAAACMATVFIEFCLVDINVVSTCTLLHSSPLMWLCTVQLHVP